MEKIISFFGMRAGVGWPALFHLLFTFLFAELMLCWW